MPLQCYFVPTNSFFWATELEMGQLKIELLYELLFGWFEEKKIKKPALEQIIFIFPN